MSEPNQKVSDLRARLSATGSKLSEISKKAATATKNAAITTAAKSKDAAQNVSAASKKMASKTNDAVKKAVSDSKMKREEKRELKAQKTREELTSQPLLDDVPPMVTLPEFENERMNVVNEQQENQLLLLEEMQRMSSRLDAVEKRQKAFSSSQYPTTTADFTQNQDEIIETKSMEMIGTSAAINEMIHILGASLVWIVALVGVDQYATDKQLMLTNAYPADLLIWSVGSFTWVMYLLFRLGKSGLRIPLLIRVQASLAVGITTLMGLMFNDDSMTTVSSVWTWGTILVIALLLGSSLLATAWKTTKSLVGIRETVEIIE
ncbi:MAG: hypothetical protein QF364_05810 [Candidatus Poseidoniaceae archaeon]|nr:hypothetical protein [Candidatus Poseidoniaceae archaeon]